MGTVEISVKPRSSRVRITATDEGTLTVHLTAPPAEGLANRQLITALAGQLKVAKSTIQLIRGSRGRRKVIDIPSLDKKEILARCSHAA